MWREDILGSEMYAETVGECGILSADKLLKSLKVYDSLKQNGKVALSRRRRYSYC